MAQFTVSTDDNNSIRALLALQELLELGDINGIVDLIEIIETAMQDEIEYVEEMIEDASVRYRRRKEPDWDKIRYRLHLCHKLAIDIGRKKRGLARQIAYEAEKERRIRKEKAERERQLLEAKEKNELETLKRIERSAYINSLTEDVVRNRVMSRLSGMLRMKERKDVTPDQYNIGLSDNYPNAFESMMILKMRWNELIDECEKQMASTE